MKEDDIENIVAVMKEPYMVGRENHYREYFKRCIEECESKVRQSFVVYNNDCVAGYVHVKYQSDYSFFKTSDIPEINDLYVVPSARRLGIGKTLLLMCEKEVAKTHKVIGLGVGLYKDYGRAHRLYTSSGYVLDGNGIMYDNKPVEPGNKVLLDDDLLLYFTKVLN